MPHRHRKRRSQKAGLPPGTPVATGEVKSPHTVITALHYTPGSITERELQNVEEVSGWLGREGVLWLDVSGLGDVQALEQIGKQFNLHPLIVEDIVNTDQRPKFEDYGSVFYIVIRLIAYGNSETDVQTDQISLVVGQNFVLSFKEQPNAIFQPVRERIRLTQGRIRSTGPDYLCYRLMDAVVDNYFFTLEKLGDETEALEDAILEGADPGDLAEIHRLRRQMIYLRKAVWPLRDVIGVLVHGESPIITRETTVYFRDVYDHAVQAMDTVDTYRDMLSAILDMYLSGVNLRLNAVMKVLTVIATIFLPLSFLASLWGMNFKYMPELSEPWGYPAALALMLCTVAGMLYYFRRKGWM
ncbi:MAG TPA: magnesium/cobalt transporter CorA [bacterium]|jgi:magnesium transporter